MSLKIHIASKKDLEQLISFNLALARETEGLPLDPETVMKGVEAVLTDPQKGFYLCASDEKGNILGSLLITTEWSDWRNAYFWWIQSVYVRPGYRNQGVFKALYEYVQTMALEKKDVCGLRLYVVRSNRKAMKAYHSLGMRPTDYVFFETGLNN